jgi:hypothetical protein
LGVIVLISGIANAQSSRGVGDQGSVERRLLGAWRLVSIEAPGSDAPNLSTGILIYITADGQLIIESARADEKWTATWQHY